MRASLLRSAPPPLRALLGRTLLSNCYYLVTINPTSCKPGFTCIHFHEQLKTFTEHLHFVGVGHHRPDHLPHPPVPLWSVVLSWPHARPSCGSPCRAPAPRHCWPGLSSCTLPPGTRTLGWRSESPHFTSLGFGINKYAPVKVSYVLHNHSKHDDDKSEITQLFRGQ